jgi:manganese efflux pump family protein
LSLLALITAAAAVGLGNFGAAISIGMSGAAVAARLRVGVVFGLFEAGMPLIGLVLGHGIARTFGSIAGYAGGGLLITMGGWQAVQNSLSRRKNAEPAFPTTGMWRLIVTGFALSMDNLVVGFTLGAKRTPLAAAIIVFAVVSVFLSLLGFEFGRLLNAAIEFRVEFLGALVLVCVGILIAAGTF